MRHFKDAKFKPLFDALPRRVQDVANRNFALLKPNPKHPSLHFKEIKDNLWSARVGRGYRALAIEGRTASIGSGLEATLTTID